jgi:hypothetical protein
MTQRITVIFSRVEQIHGGDCLHPVVGGCEEIIERKIIKEGKLMAKIKERRKFNYIMMIILLMIVSIIVYRII